MRLQGYRVWGIAETGEGRPENRTLSENLLVFCLASCVLCLVSFVFYLASCVLCLFYPPMVTVRPADSNRLLICCNCSFFMDGAVSRVFSSSIRLYLCAAVL